MPSPNEIRFPDEMLRKVKVTPIAKELAADLHHEARVDRIFAIIQLALNAAYIAGYKDSFVLDEPYQSVLHSGDEPPPKP